MIADCQTRSALTIPILYQSFLIAVVYLENNLSAGVFSQERLSILESLSSQAAVSIKNALLYQNLEKKVSDRTQELAENNEKLIRIVEKNKNLVRILVHDLNNSLTVVKMSTDILIDPSGRHSEEKKKKCLTRMQRALMNQEDIINHVRNMEAIESGKLSLQLQPVSLTEIVENANFIFKERLEAKKLTLNFDAPSQEDLYILADSVTVSNNVVNNLISNAIKFSFPEGRIDIRVHQQSDGKISLVIRDYGIGMPPHILENLFFFEKQTSRKGTVNESGTGFGMPLVKTYMDQYGGTISIRTFEQKTDNDAQGSEITLSFKKVPKSQAA